MQERKCVPDDIKLYLLDARRGISNEQRELLLRFCDDEKKERIQKRKRGREDALLADALRKFALWDSFGLCPEKQRIKVAAHGKLYLAERNDIFFNYSHSEGLIFCAVAGREVGVDIQKIKPYNARLAKRICSEEEFVQLENSKTKDEAFCRLWTKKEAAAKLYGTGIFRSHPDKGLYTTENYDDYILTLSWL